MTKLEKAIHLATKAHCEQMDEDSMPHIVHCFAVMLGVKAECDKNPLNLALQRYSLDELLAAAMLHDTVEDSPDNPCALERVDLYRIESIFGSNVRKLVDGVTRRKEGREKEPYRNFIYRAQDDPGTCLIKIADLNHNYGRSSQIKQASWRDKLEYKYHVALGVLNSKERVTWEQVSSRVRTNGSETEYFVADPNGKSKKISFEEFKKVQSTGRV